MKISFRPRAPRTLALAAAATAALLGIAMTVWLWPQNNDSTSTKVVANDYSGRPSACLAADDSAASTELVQRTWTVLQQSGQENQINVQQLVVPAKDAAEAAPYLSGLVAQRCTMIVTVGSPFASALPAIAKDTPHVRFITIAPPAGTNLAGATALAPDKLTEQLDQSIRDLTTKR
ncbi:hypothetical protein ACWEPB_30665 [Kitasatospora cineracea]